MTKLGPILSIIAGLFSVTFATIGLLAAHGVIDATFSGKFNNVGFAKGTFWVSLVIGIFQILLGIFAFKKSRGIASFILLALFATITTLGIIAGVKASSFPTSTIISLSINGVAALGLLIGFIKGD